jgi:hypothetical protein
MLNVNRPLVAVLRDDARQHLVERVATLDATLLKMRAVTGDQGSGFLVWQYGLGGEEYSPNNLYRMRDVPYFCVKYPPLRPSV